MLVIKNLGYEVNQFSLQSVDIAIQILNQTYKWKDLIKISILQWKFWMITSDSSDFQPV